MGTISKRLAELNIQLPKAPKPAGAYVPAVITGNLIFASGQTPTVDGVLKYTGKVGREVSLEEAYEAARLSAINCLAEMEAVLGDLDRIKRIVKVTGYVASAEGFGLQPKVVNGASELLEGIFGENGRHARAAIGVSELPINAPVEVEIIAEIK